MKDSYSFDIDDAGLERSYQRHREAYIRTFDRLGLPYVIVSAMSGAMGGSASEEFLAPLDVGEDTFVRTASGNYAANVEAVRVPVPDKVPFDDAPPAVVHDTPGTPTIATLVDHLNARDDLRLADREWTAADTLKNVIVKLRHPDGTVEPLAIGVPGDRDVDLKRLEAQVGPAVPEQFTDEDFARFPALAKGYIGPGALGSAGATGIRFVVDPRVVTGTRWVTGADEPGRHVVGLVAGRDFEPDGVIDVADVLAGDPSPIDGEPLELARGIEIGHIFQLGRKYAEALGLSVQGPDGVPITVTMGSYGIGVSRAVAAIAETTARRARPVLAARGRSRRRPRRHRRQAGRRAVAGRRAPRRRARGGRAAGAARRPRLGVAGREVQGRRAARHPDDRRRRPRRRRRPHRGPRPPIGRAPGRRAGRRRRRGPRPTAAT